MATDRIPEPQPPATTVSRAPVQQEGWKAAAYRNAKPAAVAPEPAWLDANLKKRITKVIVKTGSTDPVEIAKQVQDSLGIALKLDRTPPAAALRSALLISVLVVLNGREGDKPGAGVPGEPKSW